MNHMQFYSQLLILLQTSMSVNHPVRTPVFVTRMPPAQTPLAVIPALATVGSLAMEHIVLVRFILLAVVLTQKHYYY